MLPSTLFASHAGDAVDADVEAETPVQLSSRSKSACAPSKFSTGDDMLPYASASFGLKHGNKADHSQSTRIGSLGQVVDPAFFDKFALVPSSTPCHGSSSTSSSLPNTFLGIAQLSTLPRQWSCPSYALAPLAASLGKMLNPFKGRLPWYNSLESCAILPNGVQLGATCGSISFVSCSDAVCDVGRDTGKR